MSVKNVLRAVTPPVVVTGVRRVRERFRPPTGRNTYHYSPEGWVDAPASPFDSELSGDGHRRLWEGWRRALSGPGPLGVDYFRSLTGYDGLREGEVSRDLNWAHNGIMVFAYTLALVCGGAASVSILDWGGGIGQFLQLSEALVPGVEFTYACRDVPALAELGSTLNPEVTFYGDDREWPQQRFDLVLAISALQFHKEWRPLVASLGTSTSRYLLLSRVPVVFDNPTFVVVQRSKTDVLPYSFPGWYFNRDELVAAVEEQGLTLRREFLIDDETPALGVPEQATYRGLLFERTT